MLRTCEKEREIAEPMSDLHFSGNWSFKWFVCGILAELLFHIYIVFSYLCFM